MRALIILIALCGLYYGMNFYNLSDGAVKRMIESKYAPKEESMNQLCSFIKADTQVAYFAKVNDGKEEQVVNSPLHMCNYWKQYLPKKAEWIIINIKRIKTERINSFPFNAARTEFEVDISYQGRRKERDKKTGKMVDKIDVYRINRSEKIHYRRGFMGSYEYISLEGHDKVTRPEEKKRR